MENQSFKTFDIGIMFTLIAFVLVVVSSLLSHETQDPDLSRALNGAQNLALQLASGGLGSLNPDETTMARNPADVESSVDFKKSLELFGKQGKIGLDPWGNAFHYSFVEVDKENPKHTHVIVWSDGPDGKRDNSESDVESLSLSYVQSGELKLHGDDLGYIETLSTN